MQTHSRRVVQLTLRRHFMSSSAAGSHAGSDAQDRVFVFGGRGGGRHRQTRGRSPAKQPRQARHRGKHRRRGRADRRPGGQGRAAERQQAAVCIQLADDAPAASLSRPGLRRFQRFRPHFPDRAIGSRLRGRRPEPGSFDQGADRLAQGEPFPGALRLASASASRRISPGPPGSRGCPAWSSAHALQENFCLRRWLVWRDRVRLLISRCLPSSVEQRKDRHRAGFSATAGAARSPFPYPGVPTLRKSGIEIELERSARSMRLQAHRRTSLRAWRKRSSRRRTRRRCGRRSRRWDICRPARRPTR